MFDMLFFAKVLGLILSNSTYFSMALCKDLRDVP
jgi:hypothetical protein